MVQKSSEGAAAPAARRRGRPRSYEPDAALGQAMEAFWKSGYAATTLDDLSAATGMNRPSLYAAFGDKHEIYVKAYRRYRAQMRDEFRPILAALDGEAPVRGVVRDILEACRTLYLSGPDGPRGCLTVVTASSEAIANPEIRKLVVEAIAALDETFAALFAKAIARGELAETSDPAALAKLTTATIHTLAIWARAGVPGGDLQGLIDASLSMICGPQDAPKRRARAKR